MMDRNSWVRGISLPSTRSCTIRSHRANRSSILLRPLARAVWVVWAMNEWTQCRSIWCSVTLGADRLTEGIRRQALTATGDLHVDFVWEAVAVAQDDRYAHHTLASDHADLDRLLAVGDHRSDATVEEIDLLDPLVAGLQLTLRNGRSTASRCGSSNRASARDRRDSNLAGHVCFRRAQGARDKKQTTYLMLVEMSRVVDQSLWSAASVMIDVEGRPAMRWWADAAASGANYTPNWTVTRKVVRYCDTSSEHCTVAHVS